MRFFTLVFIGLLGVSTALKAQELGSEFAPVAGADTTLAEHKWVARPLVVMAESPNDPNFKRQVEMIEADWPEFAARDVVLILDTDPAAESDVRQTIRPRGFMMVLIAKDGSIAQRKPSPWTAREILRAIDKMPLRKDEVRERRDISPLAPQ
ncbi:DUF4174 domain-containing protein [Halocynthiibacter sp. C4]|uniref:DUF4174 domain-containing protein n=1 Tax=Halocynthiibacter sp. C4 TaxID=2992758 RepID=UPI00237B73BB|nr:DUF4174 domain-containing protein [Halocynthiibacter sp. C4]MDE0590197.1 DUF4174 domain-containing protein [Halocynthiibacter sp. C4]